MAHRNGRLIVTGADDIPRQPDSTGTIDIPTGVVCTFADETPEVTAADSEMTEPWKIGDPISEPRAVYQLTDGRLVLSQKCL